jgi:hypothetical protein
MVSTWRRSQLSELHFSAMAGSPRLHRRPVIARNEPHTGWTDSACLVLHRRKMRHDRLNTGPDPHRGRCGHRPGGVDRPGVLRRHPSRLTMTAGRCGGDDGDGGGGSGVRPWLMFRWGVYATLGVLAVLAAAAAVYRRATRPTWMRRGPRMVRRPRGQEQLTRRRPPRPSGTQTALSDGRSEGRGSVANPRTSVVATDARPRQPP